MGLRQPWEWRDAGSGPQDIGGTGRGGMGHLGAGEKMSHWLEDEAVGHWREGKMREEEGRAVWAGGLGTDERGLKGVWAPTRRG